MRKWEPLLIGGEGGEESPARGLEFIRGSGREYSGAVLRRSVERGLFIKATLTIEK